MTAPYDIQAGCRDLPPGDCQCGTCESRGPILVDDELYLGDNGRALCGKHSGASARYTGRDLSGHNVMRVTERMARREGVVLRCEQPRCMVARGV